MVLNPFGVFLLWLSAFSNHDVCPGNDETWPGKIRRGEISQNECIIALHRFAVSLGPFGHAEAIQAFVFCFYYLSLFQHGTELNISDRIDRLRFVHKFPGLMHCFTSVPGGNIVDGLLPATSTGAATD